MRVKKLRKIISELLDFNPDVGLYPLIPPIYEGRLISVIRRWAGSGGWKVRWRFDANALPAVQAALSWRAAARMGFLTAGTSCVLSAERRPRCLAQGWRV